MPFTLLEPSSINSTATFNFANLTVSGNIVLIGSNINSNLGNSATANYFIGNGSLLTGLPASYSNTNVAAYLPTYTGNVSANYFIGNGSQLTGLPASYSNTNVAAYLPTYTGNVSANYFIGNGSQLTNITGANVSGYVPLTTAANTAGTVTANAQPNITSVGTLSSLSVTGNVSANYFIGNGSQLTGLTAGPAGSNTQVQFNDNGVLGADSNFTFNKATGILSVGAAAGGSMTGANLISANYFTGTLTTAAQPNITSVGTLTSLTVSGNISGNVLGNPVGFRNVPPVGTKTGSYSLTTSDVGKYVQIGSGGSITIPNSTFSEGDVVGLFNNTTGTITITCSITTAYIAGIDSSKASMTLATRGVATVFFISGTVCVVSGSVT